MQQSRLLSSLLSSLSSSSERRVLAGLDARIMDPPGTHARKAEAIKRKAEVRHRGAAPTARPARDYAVEITCDAATLKRAFAATSQASSG